MRRWLGEIFRGFIVSILYGGLPIVIGLLAWLKQVPAYLIILMTLSSTALVMFVINQYSIVKNRHKKNISKFSEKEVERMVREWIDLPGFSIERQPTTNDELFNFVLKDKSGRNINISRDTGNPALLSLAARIRIFPDDKPIIDPVLKQIVREMKKEMVRLGIEYAFEDKPNQYQYVGLAHSVVINDSLTEHDFRDSIFFIVRAMVLIIEIARQAVE
jgi:hypothetical protein